jgi:hypothetical protein
MRHIIGWLAITGLVLFLSLEARPVHAETVEKVQENQTLMEKAGVSTRPSCCPDSEKYLTGRKNRGVCSS